MTKIFTLKKAVFFYVQKLMAFLLFFYLQTMFILPAQAQTSNPVVTDSATYDVFMNLDPSRGLDPTGFATDVSSYLNTLGAASGSYRINTSAVTLDPTDKTKWEVYDHYDLAWYANEAAWSASPGGFNNGVIPPNWYYYGVSDAYGGLNNRITIADLLAGTKTWGQTGTLQSHIYPYVENGKPAMQFYGYSSIGAADFLYYPADVASTKTVKFDVDAQLIDTHTLTAAGFLINGGTSGTGASKTISGYLMLISANLTNVKIYQLNNVNVDALHNSGTGALGTLVATYSSTIYSKSHIELNITSTSVTATIQQLDGSGNLTGSQSTMFNSQALTNTDFGGFGPFVLYSSHGCTSASAFRYSNLEMAFGGVLSGNSSLESYQYAEYLGNSTNRFFVNLTDTLVTNYASSSNDMDNAYLTRIKDDKVILITDESTETYLPAALNENIKDVTIEPTNATVAAALGLELSNFTSLSAAKQLAAKVAYLIFHTTLGSYGEIVESTTTAVASLYLMDGPGSDTDWTGAKQINEIRSWLVNDSINIYLNPDNSINATGLTATYELTNPSGTKTTITTSVDDNGKLYFAFPEESAIGEYSITLSYATAGSITSTIPSTATFDYVPVSPLDGTPSISGTMQYGQILTVIPNVTNNTGTLSYQWKANGTIITDATGSTYKLTASEVGKTISCDITSNVESGTLSATASGTVAKITLTPTVSAVNSKLYDGTTATTGGAISFSDTVNSENPTWSASIVWTSADVGTGTVNVSDISLTSLTDRYVLSVTSLSDVTPGNNATIGKATPTVNIKPTASAITYGQTLESSTLNTSSAVVNVFGEAIAGSYAWKTSTTKPTSAGNFPTATVTFTPDDLTIYNSIDFNISVTVAKARLTAVANNKTKVYDGAVYSPFTVTYIGFITDESATNLGGALAYSGTAITAVNVGTNYVITPSGLTSGNYRITFVAGKLDITKKALTITAEDKTKVYDGGIYSPFTVAYNGFITGESATNLGGTLAYSGTATTAVVVGTNYVITPSGFTSGNYDISFVAGKLDITKKALTITADAKSKVYGEANPALTYKITSGELVGSDVLSGSLTRAEGESVSDYAISIGDVTAGANYNISFVTANLSITQKSLTITADAQTKVYGTSLTDGIGYTGFTSIGLMNSEIIGSVKVVYTNGNAAYGGVGTYADAITISTSTGGTFSSHNYDISYIPGSLTIIRADPTVSVWPTAANICFGNALSSASLSGGSASVDGNFIYDDNTITPNSGIYNAAVWFIPTDNTNYNMVLGSVSVRVYENFTAGSIPTTGEKICYNGDPEFIGSSTVASGGDETITYKWESSTDAFTTAGTVISGATAAFYYPPAELTTNTSYRRYAHDGTCNTSFELSTGTWLVTVYSEFIGGSISSDQIICYNTVPNELVGVAPTGGNEVYMYKWQSSVDNITFTNIPGATSLNYQPDELTATTYYQLVQAPTSGCDIFTTNKITITVHPMVVKPVIVEKKVPGSISILMVDNSQNLYYDYLWTYSDGSDLPYDLVNNRQFLTLPVQYMNATYMVTVFDVNNCGGSSLAKTVTPSQMFSSVYPTVSDGNLKLDLVGDETGRIQVRIFNEMGNLFKTLQFEKASNNESIPIIINDLKVGTYMIEVSINNFKEIHRVFIR